MVKEKDIVEKMTLIQDFVSDKDSICREERQYALYLYNIIYAYCNKKNRSDKADKIIEAIFGNECSEGIVIDNVFYEATFMRDWFEYNRRKHFVKKKGNDIYSTKKPKLLAYDNVKAKKEFSFNYKLLEYFEDKQPKHYPAAKKALERLNGEYHLGQYKGFTGGDKQENPIIKDMKCMMNAKPDVAVVYHKGNEPTPYLLFLECKFESGESKDGRLPQTELQYMIADFLCQLELDQVTFGCKVSDRMVRDGLKKPGSLKVTFTRSAKKNIESDVIISIEDLIDLNKRVLGVKTDDNN